MHSKQPPGRSRAAAPAVLAAAVVLAYVNALGGTFQFDDYNVIVHNPAVHSLAAWLHSMPGIRPLLKLSYTLNWVIDSGPLGFRVFNIAVHAANAVLVYRLLCAIGRDSARFGWAPFIGALLFALHPVQTEAVAYVSGRSVSLMALFYLSSVSVWLHADRVPGATPWRILSAGLFAAALLVKETAITLPFALLLLDAVRAPYRHTMHEAVRRQGSHWLVLGAAFVLIAVSPTYRRFLETGLSTRGAFENLLTQANAIWYLASQLLLPWRVNVDPDLPVISTWSTAVALQMLAIMALVALGLRNLNKRIWLAFAILWFFVHLAPTNSLLARLDVANDRQLYLASIGMFYAVGVVAQALLERTNRRMLVAAVAGLMLAALGLVTILRNQTYASQVAFWHDAASKSPSKARVANNLGYAYQQEGNVEAARAEYERAIALDSGYWRARINLEALEASQGR
jgi:tetratricopeptide (TPR) repeat protein